MDNIILILIFLIMFAIICIIIEYLLKKSEKKLDQFYYSVNDVDPDLELIESDKIDIYNECINVYKKEGWEMWPEKELYRTNGTWKIFPFYAFGVWATENCKKCPTITRFIKSLKGVKLATLSKLSPGMKLTQHQGWENHSNHVIRCHYGLLVPKGCYISVSNKNNPPLYDSRDKIKKFPYDIYHYNDVGNVDEQIKFHRQFEWLIFDDSKVHYAENMSKMDRIVLIVDIERPKHIKKGKSNIRDSKELYEIVDYFRKTQSTTQ